MADARLALRDGRVVENVQGFRPRATVGER